MKNNKKRIKKIPEKFVIVTTMIGFQNSKIISESVTSLSIIIAYKVRNSFRVLAD